MKPLTLICLFLSLVTSSGAVSRRHHLRPRSPLATHEAQIEQNQVIDRLHLVRIKDDKQLRAMVLSGDLVRIPESLGLSIDPRLPVKRRYCRPWTLSLLRELSYQYLMKFGQPLVLTSAIRTVQVQRSLLHWNRNAAPIHGETASSHMTGATVDISRRHMTPFQNRWMELLLIEYSVQNRVIFLEETVQPCFHIMVIPPKEIAL